MLEKINFSVELDEDDKAFFAMTDEEFDERANRLAYKALNGIKDEETINATLRVYRNWVLWFGEEKAKKMIKEDIEFFGKDY
jgi:hypothetical protein